MATDNPYLTDRQSASAAAGTTNTSSTTGAAQGGGAGQARLTGSAKTQQQVGQAIEGVQQTVAPVIEGAQEKVGQVVEGAKQQTTTLLASQKDKAADTLYTVAHVLRQAGQQLREQEQGPAGQFADTVATRVEGVSGYLHGRDVRQIVDETEGFARQRPAVFVGGAVTLGLLAARFLKSSRRQQQAKAAQSASTASVPAPPSTAVAPVAPVAPPAPTPTSTAGTSGVSASATSAGSATSPGSATPGAVRVSSVEPSPAVVASASTLADGTPSGANPRAIEDDVRQAGGTAMGSTQRTTPRS